MVTERETLLVIGGGGELDARLRAEGYCVVVARSTLEVDAILGGLAVDALVIGDGGGLVCWLGTSAGGIPIVFVGGVFVGGVAEVARVIAAQLRRGTNHGALA